MLLCALLSLVSNQTFYVLYIYICCGIQKARHIYTYLLYLGPPKSTPYGIWLLSPLLKSYFSLRMFCSFLSSFPKCTNFSVEIFVIAYKKPDTFFDICYPLSPPKDRLKPHISTYSSQKEGHADSCSSFLCFWSPEVSITSILRKHLCYQVQNQSDAAGCLLCFAPRILQRHRLAALFSRISSANKDIQSLSLATDM